MGMEGRREGYGQGWRSVNCYMGMNKTRNEEMTRLIAAAPELLGALKAMLQMPTEQTAIAERAREWVRNQARAAISKAEGRAL